MKVAYVTIQFPVPSEAFAAVEMRALRRQGADLRVLTYRAEPDNAAAMLADRGLADQYAGQSAEGSDQAKVGEHSVDPVEVLAHVLKEQDGASELGKIMQSRSANEVAR